MWHDSRLSLLINPTTSEYPRLCAAPTRSHSRGGCLLSVRFLEASSGRTVMAIHRLRTAVQQANTPRRRARWTAQSRPIATRAGSRAWHVKRCLDLPAKVGQAATLDISASFSSRTSETPRSASEPTACRLLITSSDWGCLYCMWRSAAGSTASRELHPGTKKQPALLTTTAEDGHKSPRPAPPSQE
ncbi:hypothetical protein OH77DRAFT_360333 [Trametes cingulata]|nr:hypothetical protein OH77DRAFT_360333 [Trametes cingulata]